jgi:hypothetical protein
MKTLYPLLRNRTTCVERALCAAQIDRDPVPIFSHSTAPAPMLDDCNVLSAEGEVRSIEMAFLARVLSLSFRQSSRVLGAVRGGPAKEDSVTADLARMRHPVYEAMARQMAARVPPAKGFGKFRGRG